ncbi:proline-rich protein 29-like [Neoarius graeffei]|uniref:proline-rich protein 29-like n=1 Tax=Neoarius graeffei TaxID=443677 RepID=UPI00298D16A5|nr:proline-rich protein 29-like [Neoarius graeffei]
MEPSAQIQQDDFSHFQFIQQPTPQPVTLFQQLPSAMSPPAPLRPGHIKEDLVELMMMQNAQMHQVIMNNMTMSALSSFGYMQAPEHPGPPVRVEVDPEVYHHHYPCPSCVSYPVWVPMPLSPMQSHIPLQTIPSFQDPTYPPPNVHIEHRDRKAIPPTLPPSATGMAGPNIPPAAEYHEAERRQHRKEETELKQKQ